MWKQDTKMIRVERKDFLYDILKLLKFDNSLENYNCYLLYFHMVFGKYRLMLLSLPSFMMLHASIHLKGLCFDNHSSRNSIL